MFNDVINFCKFLYRSSGKHETRYSIIQEINVQRIGQVDKLFREPIDRETFYKKDIVPNCTSIC